MISGRNTNQFWLLVLLALACYSGTAPATSETLVNDAQRQLFRAAERALEQNNTQLFNKLKQSLTNYTLYPYLEYEQLKRDLAHADAKEVRRFLERWQDTPLAPLLRNRWLSLLAKRKAWKKYVAFYKPDRNVARQCHYLQALIETGRKQEALDQVEPLWLHGRSRPDACDPVFKAWQEAGRLSTELVWQRIGLAMNKGKVALVKYLQKQLPAKEQPWVTLWLELRNQPELALTASLLRKDHPQRNKLLQYAAFRKIRQDPVQAIAFWEQLQARYLFDQLEAHLVNRKLALWLVRKDDPLAWRFLSSVEPCSHDSKLQEARLRAALRRGEWDTVLAWLNRLPQDEQQTDRWQYWRARALEQLEQHSQATSLYQKLAGLRSYYGFLAADRIGAPYNLNHEKTPTSELAISDIGNRPAIRRARELVALERWPDARREWRFATRDMPEEKAMAAAKLAQSWGWHDQAIFTLAKTGYWEDLELRFPLEHESDVRKYAQKRQLDISWVYGVIRQESAFNPSVRSHAGAMGLMQLMPATASYVAKRLLSWKRKPRRADLVKPATNIELGTRYLADVLQRLGDNPVLATAAYNAGPHRVDRWLPENQLPADIWVELIPFRETRRYVERVFTYAAIYDRRLNKEVVRLTERMQPVAGRAGQKTAQKDGKGMASL